MYLNLAKDNVERENPQTVTRGFLSQIDSEPLSESSGPDILSGTPLEQGVVGIHWLRGSILEAEKKWLIERFCLYFGTEYEEKIRSFWTYDRILLWPCGVMILFNSTEEGLVINRGRISMEMPGKACELLTTWQLGQLMSSLDSHQFQCARIDLYYDDQSRRITPRQIYNLVFELALSDDQKPIREDFQHFQVITPGWRAKRGKGLIENMIMFGRRGSAGSGKYLRIYDRQLMSNGAVSPVRYELELCQKYGRGAFAQIVGAFGMESDGAAMFRSMGRMIGGCIDFRKRTERAGDKNLDRLDRYDFWQSILDGIGAAKLAGRKIVKSIEKAKEWVGNQVVGTLQMLTKAVGPEEFVAWIVEKCLGRDRLRLHHDRTIADYRLQQAVEKLKPPVPLVDLPGLTS